MGTWFSFGIVTISTSGHDNEPLFAITFTQNKEDIGCWTMEELLKESNNDLETWVEITQEMIASFEIQEGDAI